MPATATALSADLSVVALCGLLILTLCAVLMLTLSRRRRAPRPPALRDPLTGLADRQLLDDRIAHALARSRRHDGSGVALLLLNLDAFRPVNDSLGHAAGDAVLREVAARLQAQARAHDTLARLGADEFVVLLEGDAGEAVLAQIAQRLLDALAQPMTIHVGGASQPLRLSAAIGIVLQAGGGSDVEPRALIAQADSAAQAVKRSGGNGFAFFEARMQDGVQDQLELARDLRAALEDSGAGQLSLH